MHWCLWKEILSQQRIRHFKILQSIYFAYDVGIISSYSNRNYSNRMHCSYSNRMHWCYFRMQNSLLSLQTTKNILMDQTWPQALANFIRTDDNKHRKNSCNCCSSDEHVSEVFTHDRYVIHIRHNTRRKKKTDGHGLSVHMATMLWPICTHGNNVMAYLYTWQQCYGLSVHMATMLV